MSLYKYTRMARGQDGVEVMRMIDLVLMKKVMLHYVQDMRVVGGMGRGLSDHHVVDLLIYCRVSHSLWSMLHHVVFYKVRLVGAWIKRGGEGKEDYK